eukprot:1841565-Prymnesium_polylepis.1
MLWLSARAAAAAAAAAPHLRRSSAAPLLRRVSTGTPALAWKEARFNGATITLDPAAPVDDALGTLLEEAMDSVRAAGRRGVFFRVPIEQAALIPIAARLGFRFHHAEAEHAMLLAWLPSEPCPVPDFATHVLGAGGMALRPSGEVLCVKERLAPSAKSQGSWKVHKNHYRSADWSPRAPARLRCRSLSLLRRVPLAPVAAARRAA